MRLRFHCQTAAATLTKAQPMNNVVRTALQALSAVLGGAQSLHTNGLDEAYAIPSEEAMKIALRTQQIIAEETPRGRRDRSARRLLLRGGADQPRSRPRSSRSSPRSTRMGGTIKAIEEGFFQREIADSAYDIARRQGLRRAARDRRQPLVEPSEPPPIPIHKVDPAVEARQVDAARRDAAAARPAPSCDRLLDRLAGEAREPDANLMPVTIEAVKARATLGEIVARLR